MSLHGIIAAVADLWQQSLLTESQFLLNFSPEALPVLHGQGLLAQMHVGDAEMSKIEPVL